MILINAFKQWIDELVDLEGLDFELEASDIA